MCHLERMLAKRFCHAFSLVAFYPPETAMANDEEIVEFHQEIVNGEDFCEYLAEKDGRIRAASLPFPGRNVALYFNPG